MRRRSRDRDLRRGAIAIAAMATLASACTQRIETQSSRYAIEGVPPQLPPLIAPEVLSERASRAGIDARLVSLGFLRSDGISPPVICPSGRFVAVQLDPAPAWIDLVAWRPEVPRPAPAIALVPIDPNVGLGTPVVPPEPLLLGRGATSEGVLVESPRPDGSRRIGLASWRTGEIEWLVADDGVAAMATLGPRGHLAWCRSEEVGEPAGLRLLGRDGELREWPPLAESTWMLPTFSGDGRRLFALLLEDGRGRLVAFDLEDPDAEAAAWSFSNRLDARTALRSILATGPDASPAGEASWLLLHPEWNTLCRWHPADGRIDRMPAGTYAFTRPLETGRLLADAEGLWHLGGPDDRLDLLFEGVWLPRIADRSPDGPGMVLLFRPDPSGFQVVELSIEPRPPAAATGASLDSPSTVAEPRDVP